MTELDKFKRRMIRSVARLLLHEKKPEEEMWEELKKETGCDCKLLWQRMRALTMKKLKRLLAAEDRTESIAAVARLSLTDWLLFDMVLVHEQLDVIGREKISATNVEYKPMMDVFSLVQRYSIEGAHGDQLAERWSAATVAYNTHGRYCSPMLLQRRWYQIKELARYNFYKLWFSYRGNHKLWGSAQQYRPSRLQMAIAKRYPHVVTQEFPTWEEQIEKQLIILPEVFDEKMRMTNLPKPCDDNDPDLIVLEPIIETIDLGVDSDTEDLQDNRGDTDFRPADSKSGPASVASSFTPDEDSNTMTSIDIDLSTVKQEPKVDEIDGLSNVKILQTTHIIQGTVDNNTDVTIDETLPIVKVEVEDPKEMFKRNLLLNVNEFIESTQEMFQESESAESGANKNYTDSGVTEIEQETLEVKESIMTEVMENLQTKLETQNLEADDMIKQKAEQFLNKKFVAAMSASKDMNVTTVPLESSNIQEDDNSVVDDMIKEKAEQYISNSGPVKETTNSNIQENSDSNDSVVDDIIKQKAEEYVRKSDTKTDVPIEFSNDIFVDDGIEYVEDEDSNEYEESHTEAEVTKEIDENDGVTPKFDLKLIMNPIVYSMKLDNMIVLQGNNFESVADKDLIERIVTESKPVSKLSINVLQIKQENKINQQLNLSNDKKVNDDLFKHNDLNDSCEYESDIEYISEDLKIKPTSYLLQKPRSRSYNPIQLCKNPDFNTRLKRLTVGFFVSQRNRQLIKACKPMTIDVHKAFEPKLVNGTLYLKSNGGAPQPIIVEDNDQSERTAVVPSAMPMQSLIDNTVDDMLSPNRNTNAHARGDETAERNKVINLPDIKEIRRINQLLQTAEVTPIRVQHTNDVRRPSSGPPLVDLSVSDKTILNGVENETEMNFQETISTPLLNLNIIDNVDAPTKTPLNQSNKDNMNLLSVLRSVATINVSSSSVPQSGEIDNAKQNISFPANPTTARHSLPIDTSIVDPPFRQTSVGPKKVGRPLAKLDKPKMKAVPYYPMNHVNPVPWNKAKRANTSSNLDEFLITIDTLNKMINKINGHDLYKNPNKKNKKQYWVIDDDEKKVKSNENHAVTEKSADKEQTAANEKKTDKQKVPAKRNVVEGERVVPKKKRRKKDCCWAKYKLDRLGVNKRFYKVHSCPLPICICCCREQLAVFLDAIVTKNQEVANKWVTSIDLSDEEDDALRNACASIETVVQQASTPTPIVRVIPGDKNINPSININMTPQFPIPTNDSDTNSGQGLIHVIETATMLQHNSNVSSESVIFSPSCDTSTRIAGRGLPLDVGNVSSKRSSIEQTQNEGTIGTLISEETVPLDTPKICTPVNSVRCPSNKMYIPVPCSRSLLKAPKITIETQTTDVPLPKPASDSPPKNINKQANQRQFALMPIQRKLVIDGSKKFPVTRRVVQEKYTKKERVLSLNMTKKPIESPICLGKNKILLTTVKFPRVPVPQVESVAQAVVIPTSPLPAGVHLLLMPNGELTYSVDPEVQLDDEQLKALPAILAAIQQQINVSSVQPVNKVATMTQDEVIKLSDDENTSANDENSPKEHVSPPSTNQDESSVPVEPANQQTYTAATHKVNVDQSKQNERIPHVKNLQGTDVNSGSAIDTSVNAENQSDTNNIEVTEHKTETYEDKQGDNQVTRSSSLSVLCAEGETPNITNTDIAKHVDSTAESTTVNELKESKSNENAETPITEAGVTVNDSVTAGSRNLLSDLMEMSGISTDDTRHNMPQESMLQEILSTNTQNTTQLNTAVNTSVESETMNFPELTAVTSLAELKYACENNGKFFKLDLDSGIIVAINVCIKKNPKSKAKLTKPLDATSTIDLTDDVEGTKSAIRTSPIHVYRRLQKIKGSRMKPCVTTEAHNEPQTDTVKPVKLFKAVHSVLKPVNKVPILNRKAFGPNYTFVNSEFADKIKKKQNRKQALDKIEAKIDLIDSDAPMEEEYLVESSDSEDDYTVQISNNSNISEETVTVPEDDDVSSDDEPLAKKAKRMRCDDMNKETEDEQIDGGNDSTKNNEEVESEMIEKNPSKATDTAISAQSTTNIADAEVGSEISSKQVDNDSLNIMENYETSCSFMEDDDSDSQGDCILGV